MEELKPCVFCGHDGARVIAVDEVTDAGCEEATVPLYAASCPFCGSMHIFIKDSEEAFEDRSIFVWCEDCGAMVSSPDGEILDEKGNVIIPKTREAYIQHTIEAWNRRA